MIISDKQLLKLYQVLMDSLLITDGYCPFKYDQQCRVKLAEEILNQQSNELKENG